MQREEITEGQPFDVIRGNPKNIVVTLKYYIPYSQSDFDIITSMARDGRVSDIEDECLRYKPSVGVEKI